MISYPQICQRLFNRPHFIARDKADPRLETSSGPIPVPTLVVDAVADGPKGGPGDDGDDFHLSVDIQVADSVDDGNETFQTGETGW